MLAKRLSRALALLLILPSAAFALGLGDIRLLSPLNAPLDAEIELVDVTPEELISLQAQIASRDTFSRYGLDWPAALSSVTVRTVRTPDGREVVKLKSNDSITEPFLTILVEVTWAHGRLVREYTMLLDPPVYTPGQSAASNAPVSGPSAGASTREGSISRGSQLAPPAGATSGVSASAEPAPTSAVAAPGEAKPATAAGTTRVVKRGDTLSRIAGEVSGSGSDSAQGRSWMLAIYQANPRAFEQNMNVLHSGAVLRIPDASEAAAVSPTVALTEIRRQFVAWRASTPSTGATAGSESGRLRLVTPSESASAGTGGPPSNEVKALQGRVHDLEGQLNDSKRLLEMRNAELAQLQARLAAQKAPPAASPPAPQPEAAPAAPAEPPTSARAEPPSAAPAPAETPPAQAMPPAEPPAAASQPPAPIQKPTPASNASETGGGFVDTLKGLWWLGALLVLALLGLMGVRFWRSRRESEFDDSLGRLAAAGASTAERGFASGDTAPMRSIPSAAADAAFLVEESGTHERPRLIEPAPAAHAPRHVSTDETISSETAINLDQGDPLAEADFHMAYGLYDQAADLIRISIGREPERRDLKLKLLEVFFVWGNKEQFLQAAHELAGTRAAAAPGEWEKILIMGKQLAPDDALFSGAGAVSGATAGGVDLDLEGGQQRVDFDLVGDPIPGQAMPSVDLDIGSALGDFESTAESPAHPSDRTATTRQMTAKLDQDTAILPPEFGADAEGPTVEQPALASRETPTIRQKVEMALKQGGSGGTDQTAELAIDDLGLDLGALDTVDQPGLGASSEGPTLVAGFDDHSRQVMEQARRRAGSDQPVSATGTWKLDTGDLESALAQRSQQEAENGRDTTAQTSRLDTLDLHTSTMDAQKIDFDLGEGDIAHTGNGAGLDLDLGTATTPDAVFTSTQKLSAEDLALPDVEPVTMSEVGTKLDLARAYMDMGDPDGARNILEEVLHEGSVAQKQEAQRLMESLPG